MHCHDDGEIKELVVGKMDDDDATELIIGRNTPRITTLSKGANNYGGNLKFNYPEGTTGNLTPIANLSGPTFISRISGLTGFNTAKLSRSKPALVADVSSRPVAHDYRDGSR